MPHPILNYSIRYSQPWVLALAKVVLWGWGIFDIVAGTMLAFLSCYLVDDVTPFGFGRVAGILAGITLGSWGIHVSFLAHALNIGKGKVAANALKACNIAAIAVSIALSLVWAGAAITFSLIWTSAAISTDTFAECVLISIPLILIIIALIPTIWLLERAEAIEEKKIELTAV